MHRFLLTTLIALLLLPAAAMAASPPHIVGTSTLTAHKSHQTYSFGAVVRFDRKLSSSEQRRLGLIATPWASRAKLATGSSLPDALFGGTSLGRIGASAKHCYVTEVATLRAVHSVRDGSAWRVALHDGHKVLRVAKRTTVHVTKSSDPGAAAQVLGCS